MLLVLNVEGLKCFLRGLLVSEIKRSPQQQEALKMARAWIENPGTRQVFYLAGFAGTGKSTLARHLAADVPGRVFFGAYTGKAALVMRQMGCHNATTIHKMIYLPKDKSRLKLSRMKAELEEIENRWNKLPVLTPTWQGLRLKIRDLTYYIQAEEKNLKRPSFTLNTGSEIKQASLVVIDEVSMIGEDMGEDLLSFDVPILVLGDPAQLPPIKSGGFFTKREPDFMLTEIHRQAAGSPVIELATMVRQGNRPPLGDYGDSRIIGKGELSISDLVTEFDQILVGMNATRHDLNRQIREEIGRTSHLPEPGDRLVCLRNDHEIGLLNGAIWEAVWCEEIDEDRIMLTLREVDHCGEQGFTVEAHRHYFEHREDELAHWEVREAQCFSYGYALTVHKAQGSQWNNVLVIDESRTFRQDARRWLYTAITRAAKSVTIIDKNGYAEEVETPW